MTKLLNLNGKTYKPAEFDVNLVCDFEENGISLDDIDNKMFSVLRAYVAASVGCDLKTAGKLMTDSNLEDIAEVMTMAMDDSGFFRNEQTGKKTENQTRAKKKKSENEDVISPV